MKEIMEAIKEEMENQTGDRSYEAEDRIRSWGYEDDIDEFLSIFGY